METNSSVIETTRLKQPVIELTAEMEIPPERQGRIYDLTEVLNQIVDNAPTAPQAPFPSRDDLEDLPLEEDPEETAAEPAVPCPAIERIDDEIELQPDLDIVEDELTTCPQGIEPAETACGVDTEDQPTDSDFPGMEPEVREIVSFEVLEPNLDTAFENLTEEAQPELQSLNVEPEEHASTDAQNLTADIGIPLEEDSEEEETVLERYILGRYDADLDRMIDSVVARAVRNKIADLMPSIS